MKIKDENLQNFLEKISFLEKAAWEKLKVASDAEDYTQSTSTTEILKDIKSLKDDMELCYTKYTKLQEQVLETSATKEVDIEISEGAIRENYLIMSPALKAGLAPTDERLITIRSRIGEVQTKVLQKYKRLQDRSFIGKCFQDFDLVPGDKLVWKELEKNKLYEISPLLFDGDEVNIEIVEE